MSTTDAEKFRGIAESSPDSIFTADLEGRLTYFSSTVERFGYRPEEIVGKNITDFLLESDIPKASQNFTTVARGESIRGLELKVLRKDGTLVCVEVDASPIIKEGRAVSVVGILRDITERRKMEEELKSSQLKWDSLTQNSDDIIMVVNDKGTIQYVSKTITPYTPEGTVGKSLYEYVPRDQHKVMRESLTKVFRTGNPENYEVSSNIPNMGIIWFNTKLVPIKNDGNINSVIMVSTNITERKKMEEELKERAQLLDAAVDSIFLLDSDWNIIYANEATYRTYGYSRDELLKMNISDLIISENAELIEPRQKKLMAQGEGIWESVHIRKDKSVIPIEAHASIIEVDGRKRILSVVRDITARKQAEERVRQLQEFLMMQVNLMPIALITWDSEFRVKTWNPSAIRIFGYSEEEALGKHPYDIILPKEAQSYSDEILDRLIKGDVTAHSMICENITKDGRTIICSWTHSSYIRDDSTVMGILSMVQDITEQKKAEERVRELVYRLDGVSPGYSYLCESHEQCLKIFVDLTMHNIPSLCIIRENPQDLIQNYDLKAENVVLLSSRSIAGCKAVDDIQDVSIIMSQFLKKSGQSVVLLDGLEYLITHSGFNTAYKMLQEKRFDFLEAKAVLLIPVALETLNSQERALLLTEMKILK